MRRMLDEGMQRINDTLTIMSELSVNTVNSAIKAYRQGKKLVEVDRWAKELKDLHEKVGELSIELIARYQPLASDLRFIRSCMEISYGLFRLGRYAHDIVEVVDMFGDLSTCNNSEIEIVADKTKEMNRASIIAFLNRDINLAKKVVGMDDFVDSKYREHISSILAEPEEELRCLVSRTLVLRYLERIADHAAYISELIIYMVSGRARSS